LIGFKLDVCTQIIRIYKNMRSAKNDEIESEVYDEFLSTDLTEQKELEEDDNNSYAKTIKRMSKDSVSTFRKIYYSM
jgi:hypothetical protein